MILRRKKTDRRAGGLLTVALMLSLGCASSRANVYATDIRLNGSTNNAAILATNGLQISYILNEPATLGVTVQIESNSAVLWSTNLAGGMAGTDAGSNSINWDGSDQTTLTNAAAGIYSISITAETEGYTNWTNITDDSANFQVPFPMSIAVNKNTNSPFYGRVFVGSAPFDKDLAGIEKFNADGSPPDEGGGLSTGAYPWAGRQFSPWKIGISSDDKVYIDDWSSNGIVLAFDEVISTNYLTVLNTNNYSYPAESLSGPWVTGAGTNTLLFMADANTNLANGGSAGILEWGVTNNGMLGSNDTGTTNAAVSTDTNGLTVAPWDMCLDTNGNIYAIQSLDGLANTNYANTMRVFCFTTNGGLLATNALWGVWSTNEDLENAYGIAVDPTATFVAVAVLGYAVEQNYLLNGGVNIYYATNGQLVTQLDVTNGLDHVPEYTDVAWDNAGNLYATDYGNGVWRVYSPPGTNQATTVAAAVVQVYDTLAQPLLCAPQVCSGQFGFTLQGQSNVTYVIQSSPDLITWTNAATNYDPGADRAIQLPVPAGPAFYQAVVP
ncbi:MAG: hypothetical protein ABSA47_02420 [Verrucomicrobiota bacterium]|jgi:hypothetical protein